MGTKVKLNAALPFVLSTGVAQLGQSTGLQNQVSGVRISPPVQKVKA